MAVNQAFARRKALPGYVEHQFGRLPVEPGRVGTLADMVTARVKEKATEKWIGKLKAVSRVSRRPSSRSRSSLT